MTRRAIGGELVGFVVVVLACVSCAMDTDDEVGARVEAIQGGVDDVSGSVEEGARRDAVVVIVGPSAACTATLITPRLLLTADHCAPRAQQWAQFGIERVPTSPVQVPVLGCIPFSGLSSCGTGNRPGFPDVALFVLARRVDADPATGLQRTGVWNAIPMAVRRDVPPGGWLGENVTAVGFGLDGDGSLLGSTVPARRQRKSVTIIASPGPLGFDLTFPSHWEGDSGGPSYYGAIDFAEIAGVHSSGDSVARATDVAVTGAPIQDWLVPLLSGTWNGHYLGATDVPLMGEAARTLEHDALDPDKDGLFAEHDNCPVVFNPDQADGDLDGLGDLCDHCAGTVDRFFADVDGDGYNDLTCDHCPLPDPLGVGGPLDTDGDGISDGCDICVRIPDRLGAPNCNRDAELAEGRPELPDACDPTPCPESVTTSIPTRAGTLPFDSTVENSSVTMVGRAQRVSALSADAEAGLRFCRCDIASDDTLATRRDCSDPPFNCALDAAQFAPPVPSSTWRTMTLTAETAGPACALAGYGDLRCSLSYTTPVERRVDWDFASDMTTWTIPFTPDPYSEELHGVLWSHTAGGYVRCLPSPARCTTVAYDDPVASHYSSSPVERTPRMPPPSWREADVFFPVLIPPRDCTVCRAARRFAWMIGAPCLRPGMCGLDESRLRFPGFDRLGDELIDSSALLALGDRWVSASDAAFASSALPLYIHLAQDGTALGGGLVRDTKGKFVDAKTALANYPAIPTVGLVPPAFARFEAVYRAADLTAFVLGVPAALPGSAQLYRIDVVSGGYTPIAVRLPSERAVVDVLALALRTQDQALYALVETARPARRGEGIHCSPPAWRSRPQIEIVRVPLDGTDAETLFVVGPPRPAHFDQHAILFDGLGRLILLGWDHHGYVAVRAPPDALARPDGFQAGADWLVAAPVYDGDGVSFLRAVPSRPPLWRRRPGHPPEEPDVVEASGFSDGDFSRPHGSGLAHAF